MFKTISEKIGMLQVFFIVMVLWGITRRNANKKCFGRTHARGVKDGFMH